jgi:hypothetical protein
VGADENRREQCRGDGPLKERLRARIRESDDDGRRGRKVDDEEV